MSLVHFDAHSDTWPDTDEGAQSISHGTMFYYAAKQGLVDPSRSVQIGLRTTNDDVMGFQVLDARQVHRSSPEQIAELIRARVGDNPVCLTCDIDCLDPAFAPGAGTPLRVARAQQPMKPKFALNVLSKLMFERRCGFV